MENMIPLSRVEAILMGEPVSIPQSRVEYLLQKLVDKMNELANTEIYKAKGSILFANLPIPAVSNDGWVYDVTDDFITDSRFKAGAGQAYPGGTNVVIINTGTEETPIYKYDVLSGFVNMDLYVQKEAGKGLSTNDYTTKEKTKLAGIASGAEVNVQSDWNESDNSSDAYIQNKPTLGTAAGLDVPTTGDASSSEVVKGDDSRVVNSPIANSATGTSFSLTDAANAPLAGLVIEGRTTKAGDVITNVGDNGLNIEICEKNLAKYNTNTNNMPVCDELPAGTYTFSVKYAQTDGALNILQRINGIDTVLGTIYSSGDVPNVRYSTTFSVVADAVVVINAYNYSSFQNIQEIQLERGSTATEYEPYKGSTATLFTGLPLCSLTGIKEVADFTAGVVHKKCQKIVMDGSENWVEWDNHGAFLFDMQDHFAPIAPIDAPPNMICDKIPVVKLDSIYTGIGITNGIAITVRAVCVRIENIATVADLKTYLASNPVTIVYELAEPYDAPMTASEVAAYHDLRTFENTTNITCADSPQMTINYLIDTENGASIGQVTENMAGFIQSLAFVWHTPEMHRMIFRGKYLGDHVTDAQIAAIRDGSFNDLYVGDHWVMGGVNWRIADMDYWLGCGDTAFNSHHLVIVPDTCLYNAQMNDDNITTGGYVGSKMYTENLNQAKTTINSLFVDMVLSHREYLVNAVSNGKASGGAWLDSTVELMNESMVYGHREFTPGSDGTTVPTNYTIGKTQLALFALAPKFITNRVNQWLRDVVSAAHFAFVDSGGNAYYYPASYSSGVRPVFAIG